MVRIRLPPAASQRRTRPRFNVLVVGLVRSETNNIPVLADADIITSEVPSVLRDGSALTSHFDQNGGPLHGSEGYRQAKASCGRHCASTPSERRRARRCSAASSIWRCCVMTVLPWGSVCCWRASSRSIRCRPNGWAKLPGQRWPAIRGSSPRQSPIEGVRGCRGARDSIARVRLLAGSRRQFVGAPGAPDRLLWTEGNIDTAAMQIGAWSIVWRIAEKS
jgi:hypothetical protein